jgi:hypothetical protein
MTHRRPGQLIALLLFAANFSMIGCGGRQGPEIEVAHQFLSVPASSGKMAAWLAYAMVRRQWIDFKFQDRFPQAHTYRYTFDEELDARDSTAAVWTEMREKEQLSDRYLGELSLVHTAGFMPEYVWHCVPHGPWRAPAGLRSAEFTRWLSERLPDHHVETWVAVLRGSDGRRVVVGIAPHKPERCAVLADREATLPNAGLRPEGVP